MTEVKNSKPVFADCDIELAILEDWFANKFILKRNYWILKLWCIDATWALFDSHDKKKLIWTSAKFVDHETSEVIGWIWTQARQGVRLCLFYHVRIATVVSSVPWKQMPFLACGFQNCKGHCVSVINFCRVVLRTDIHQCTLKAASLCVRDNS